MDLRINLNPAVLRNHLIGDRDTFMNRNPLLDDSVMLHAAARSVTSAAGSGRAGLLGHAEHPVNLGDAEPV